MKMQAEIPLADVPSAGHLRELLDAFAGDSGDRVIPSEAVPEIVTTTRYEDRPGGSSTVIPTALRFTWER